MACGIGPEPADRRGQPHARGPQHDAAVRGDPSAVECGGQDLDAVFVVRSGPSLERIQIALRKSALKNGRADLVGYVGIMGKQEGIEYLLKTAHHIVYELGRHDIQFDLVSAGPLRDSRSEG